MNATCATILSYSARHLARVEALWQKTFIFDLVLQSGGSGLALLDEEDPGKEVAWKSAAEVREAADGALQKTLDVLHEKRASDDEDSDVVPADDDSDVESEQPAEKVTASAEGDEDDPEVRSVAHASSSAAADAEMAPAEAGDASPPAGGAPAAK